jgi:hypothetical protein
VSVSEAVLKNLPRIPVQFDDEVRAGKLRYRVDREQLNLVAFAIAQDEATFASEI